MSPDYWQKIKLILDEALAQPLAAREAYLVEHCGVNQTLRRDVESLLAFENADDDALEASAFASVEDLKPPENNFAGKTFGVYKILEKIGEGGMGAVFLAERSDGEFQQKVAVKIIHGGIGSETVLRRFLNERQILAGLEHPNIARLIDGGTTPDGIPFLVMEYVEGLAIDEYAERNNLSVSERLDLFRRICAAVGYAHKNLVIHRDLKPSNILVAENGEPKLLDFGIAKLLKTGGNETQTRQFAFTPNYASPEQARGEKLTTATDVYSLGIILYELLTGNRPYQTDSRNFSEMMQLICETDPIAPSRVWIAERGTRNDEFKTASPPVNIKTTRSKGKTKQRSALSVQRYLKGDLDTIILKSLRKEPERRYSSVEQFAEDVRRHQAGLPVVARNNTWNYRAGKFISRNRAAMIFAALIVLALIGGIVGTTWQAIRAERERERAERRFENLRKISNSLVSEIERSIRDLPGSLPARQLLLTRALEQLDALAAESDGSTDLQLELVWAYQNLGAMPDGKLSVRKEIYEKAVALTENILAAEPNNTKARDRLAMLYLDLIVVSRLRGDVEYTVEYNRRAVEIVSDIFRNFPDVAEYRDSFWTANYHYALTLQQLGKASEATETARNILPTAEKMYELSGETDGYDFMKPHLTHLQIGYGLSYAGDYQAAVKEFETALAECQKEAVKRPNTDILRRNEANIRLQLAAALENSGKPGAALENVRAALIVREQMAANNPKDLDFQIAVADAELFLGQMLLRQNQPQTVVPRLRRALEIYEKIAAIDEDRVQAKILIARTQASLGNALASNGDAAEGLRNLREAVKFYESVNAAATIDAHLKRQFAETCAYLAAALAKNKTPENLAEARAYYRKSLELWRDLENGGKLKHSDNSQPGEISKRLMELESAKIN